MDRRAHRPGAPHDLRRALDEGSVVQGLLRGRGAGHQAVVGHESRPSLGQVVGDLLAQLDRAGALVLAAGDVTAEIHHHLFDDGRDGLMGEGEHGGVHGMGVDHRSELGVAAQRRQVQVLLGGGGALPGHDGAVEVDDDEVRQRHRVVRDRGRGQADPSIGQAAGDVAGGALHEPVGEHLLGRRQDGLGCGGGGRDRVSHG